MPKILVTIEGEYIAPRFDMCTEVWLGQMDKSGSVSKQKILVLQKSSAEELCHLILSENVEIVICNAIEEEYFDYLSWKKVLVYDSIIANYQDALKELSESCLVSGKVIRQSWS